jgi:hypothetical protein
MARIEPPESRPDVPILHSVGVFCRLCLGGCRLVCWFMFIEARRLFQIEDATYRTGYDWS